MAIWPLHHLHSFTWEPDTNRSLFPINENGLSVDRSISISFRRFPKALSNVSISPTVCNRLSIWFLKVPCNSLRGSLPLLMVPYCSSQFTSQLFEFLDFKSTCPAPQVLRLIFIFDFQLNSILLPESRQPPCLGKISSSSPPKAINLDTKVDQNNNASAFQEAPVSTTSSADAARHYDCLFSDDEEDGKKQSKRGVSYPYDVQVTKHKLPQSV